MLLPGRIYIALGPWHFGAFGNIFLPNIGEDQKKSYDFSSGSLAGTQARSQKFAMGGCFGGLGRGPQSPEANEVRGQSPQLLEAWGLGAEPPALKIFAFFCKMNLILELF